MDDLVKQLRDWRRGMYNTGWLHLADSMDAVADRIEELEETLSLRTNLHGEATHVISELEAKLAKAEEFTKGVIRHAGNSGDDYLAEQARTTLAELKGQDDER